MSLIKSLGLTSADRRSILKDLKDMSLIKADVGSVCARVRSFCISSTTPTEPLYTSLCTAKLNAIRKQKCFSCNPFYGRACRRNCHLKDLRTKKIPKGSKGPDLKDLEDLKTEHAALSWRSIQRLVESST